MDEIDKKQHRHLNLLLKSLFGKKAFEPNTFEAAKRLGLRYLHHEIRLHDSRSMLLTQHGLDTLRDIDQILRHCPLSDHAEQADVSNALRSVLANLLSQQQMPDDAQELVSLLKAEIEGMCHQYWYVIPVNGLELKGVDSVQLGGLKIIQPSLNALASLGVTLSEELNTIEHLGRAPCIVGNVYGTEKYTKREFRFRADLAVGVVAAVAAVSYQDGAAPFRITIEMSPDSARASARYIFWHDGKTSVTHVRGWTEHQTLLIDKEMAEYLQTGPYIQHALSLATREDLSLLEKSIMRALFWFSDAQRDTVRTMQLVKFWSCAEVIFSGDKDAITKTVSEGVAGMIVFGGFNFKTVEEYADLVRALKNMYDKRSEAVHGAKHDHVTWRDTASLSQWTAYMLLGVIAQVVENGYTKPSEITLETRRLAKVMARSNEIKKAPSRIKAAANPDGSLTQE